MKNILSNKLYLYLTEFFAGVSVMAVELAASRFMAPYFSSSQIVYTIIIGTVMIAMALGNLYGGRVADRKPDPSLLYRRMLIASAWIAAIPLVGRYIVLAISGVLVITINTNFLIIAAFATCMIVFVYPLFLLGTVTPSLVRYIMDDANKSGEIVGRLGACNTVGSIIGTFLPTFVTIPAVGTAATFIIFSSVLTIIALVYFISIKRITISCIVCTLIVILCAVFGGNASFAFWQKDMAYEGESVYNYLQVTEDSEKTVLSTNVLFGVQSVKMNEPGLTGMYYDYALAGPAMVIGSRCDAEAAGGTEDTAGQGNASDSEAAGGQGDKALDILILGNGTGTFATQCDTYYTGAHIDAVEIDDSISDLAYEYFDLSEAVNLSTYDGRAYLQAIDNTYDVILVDAYQDITIPFQMSSVEFFTLVRDHLKDDGVMIVNMNMHSDGEGSINQYLTDTIGYVFPNVACADVAYNSNRELFAGKDNTLFDSLQKACGAVENQELVIQLTKVYDELELCETGNNILTDDKAPVEVLGMSMIDSLIQSELAYYKDMYEENGLDGLMNELL